MTKNNSPNLNENASKNDLEVVTEIGIDKLKNFEKHPFKVVDETLEELKNSITENGITTPLIVRKLKDDNYEIVSGHRRKRACELLGIDKLPCVIRDISRDEAIIQMVDSNIQREEVLPSERAFAYKMRLDAMKRQAGRPKNNSVQLAQDLKGKTSREILGEQVGESQDQIRRYIRLTELIPELLQMVDDKRIAFNPAVELSYLRKNEQEVLLDSINCFESTPSLGQAQEMKRLSQQYELTEEKIDEILGAEKANQIPKYQISYDKFERYIPRNLATPKEVENYLLKCAIICKNNGIRVNDLDINSLISKQKDRNRDAR